MATDKWLKLPKRNPAWNETSATTVWYYFSTSGKMVSDGWSKIGGKYYYFDGDGAMQTGWVDDDTFKPENLPEEWILIRQIRMHGTIRGTMRMPT